MHSRTAVILLAIGVLTVRTDASRRFIGYNYLDYDSSPTVLVSGTQLGLSVWIRLVPPGESTSGLQRIIDNIDANGDGFRLTYDYDDTLVTLTYHGPTTPFGEDEISVSADISSLLPSEQGIDDWIHVAADLKFDLGFARAHIFVNGSEITNTVSSLKWFAPFVGSTSLAIGGAANVDLFEGDIHDVALASHKWNTSMLTALQTESAADVVAPSALLFNARLRQDPAATGSDPTVFPLTPTALPPSGYQNPRGMGPPIAYGDQEPTVLIIGDTQNLDDPDGEGSEDPDEAEEMTALGEFVRIYADSLQIRAVFHAGDWVNKASSGQRQTYRARALANGFVSSGIPWACTVGNHDYGNVGNCNPGLEALEYWSSDEDYTMPTRLFKFEDGKEGQPPNGWFIESIDQTNYVEDGPYGPGDPREEPYTYAFQFDLGGATDPVPQIGITLPWVCGNGFGVSPGLDWVQDVADANPDQGVWLVTHWFLEHDGQEQNTAVSAWASHLQDIENLAFIFSGHVGGNFTAYHRCHYTNSYEPVWEFVLNGQVNPEDFTQILTCTVSQGDIESVSVETYLPLSDEFYVGSPVQAWKYSFDIDPNESCGPDCNGNLIPDQDDLDLEHTSEDCNGNGVPDECDIADHTSPDCNGNGIPDECEPPLICSVEK